MDKNTQGKKIWKKEIVYLTVFCVALVAVHFTLYLIYGKKIQPDSYGYITMVTSREPVYPLLLALFRWIFNGNDIYLDAVVILQNLLSVFAICFSTYKLWKRFSQSIFSLIGMYMIHVIVMFICQYASEFHSVLSNNILTEGITVSLWLVFIALAIDVSLDYNIKKFIIVFVLITIMIDTRKQMFVALVIFAISFTVIRFIKDEKKVFFKRFVICLVTSVICLMIALTANKIYNLVLHGTFTKNTRDMNLVLTTSLYVADEEDAKLIEEDSVRELFDMTMDKLKESDSNYSYAESGLRTLEEHYEEHYDIITVDTTSHMFVEYAEKEGFKPGIEAEQEADRMSKVIINSLLKDNIGKYGKVYLASLIHGLIKTVSKRGTLTDLFALLMYLGYIMLMIICLNRKDKRDIGLVGLIGLIAIIVNVGVVAALIFCDTRYMIYNMSVFYVIGIIMFEKIIKDLIKKKDKL